MTPAASPEDFAALKQARARGLAQEAYDQAASAGRAAGPLPSLPVVNPASVDPDILSRDRDLPPLGQPADALALPPIGRPGEDRPVPVLAPDPYSEAAARVPWRMSAEEYERYLSLGVPEDLILSVPGSA